MSHNCLYYDYRLTYYDDCFCQVILSCVLSCVFAFSWASKDVVWNNMLAKDKTYTRNVNMMAKHPHLQPKMRAVLLDWLMEVTAGGPACFIGGGGVRSEQSQIHSKPFFFKFAVAPTVAVIITNCQFGLKQTHNVEGRFKPPNTILASFMLY